MSSKWIFAFLSGALLCAGDASRAPVLVELFTSEGCSSCPPADRLLEQLDPHAIVLSEHVDYWNRQGWKDPFSSHSFTQRQQDYGRRMNTDGPYTPQMIVDGAAEFNGSDSARAAREIAAAARKSKAAIKISRTSSGLQVDVTDASRSANVIVVVADNEDASQVSAGENNGRRLHHVAVVRSMRKMGSVKKGGAFSQAVEAPQPGQRLVVFLQEGDVGPIDGAAVWQ